MPIHEKNQPQSIDDILGFWFGSEQTATAIAREKSELWWSKNDRIDAEITHRFAATTAAATNGELQQWGESPRGLLALIICTDQFPRNMYRNTPQSFSCDPIALRFAKQGMQSGVVQSLQPIQRTFAYLPFEHSEQLPDQQQSVALYQTLAESVAENERELFANYCEFARQHFDIIQRFGRFPHRNQILGRASTDEELAFLEQPDSAF